MTSEETRISDEILDNIKRIILEEAAKLDVKVERIILFGSRARGDAREDSDYDILIIVKTPLNWKKRLTLFSQTHRRIVKHLKTPVDILIIDTKRYEERKKNPLTLEAEATKGVQIPL